MKANKFSVEKYLRRIGYEGALSPTIECLAEVMRCQLFTVPFENLDVLSKVGVSLEPDDVVGKIIERGRGGYCYEVNGVFAMFLEAMQIKYRFVAARPMFYPMRRPRTHVALIVEVSGDRWLMDLGFGSYGIRAPMALSKIDEECQQGADCFRITLADDGDFLLQAKIEGEWRPQYAFADIPSEWIDFYPANFLNSNHPDAIFVQKPVLIIYNQDGRDILVGDTYKKIRNGVSEATKIDETEYKRLVADVYGISLPSAL